MAEKKRTTTSRSTKASADATALAATIYSQTGKASGTIALPEAVFGLAWNNALVHQVVTGQLANARAGTAHTKDRGEVSGGGKKPWRQKGTGRARHGSSRSPIWVGGGVTHGPRSEKDYSKKINRKVAAKALMTVLSRKVAGGTVLFVDTLALNAPKTKDAAAVLSALSGIEGFKGIASAKKTAVLIALPEITESVKKSFANLPGVTLSTVAGLSALSAFNAAHIVLVDPAAAVETLQKKVGTKK